MSGPNRAMAPIVTRKAPSERPGAGAQAIAAGGPAPLGATVGAGGVNFSVFAKRADRLEVLLYDHVDATAPARVIPLDAAAHRSYHYWHAFVPDLGPGQLYAFRAHGPFAPEKGRRFDGDKVLLDPYGLAVAVPAGYSRDAASRPGDNSAAAMKSVVADPRSYDWEGDALLRRPWAETIIYEMHVAGFTRHPSSGVAPAKRGTYAGLIEKIPYLQDLGVTAVELLPVFQFDPLHAPNGVNYWGYQPISFFAPHHAFSSQPDPLAVLDEFRDMVKALHRAGIEVILDVVYNHTAEGGQDGPTISYKGLANDTYYILEKDRSRYADFTGCANTLNANQSIVRRHDPRQPALLGDGDARRRLPLRPRVHPLARRERPSPAEPADPVGHRIGSAAGRHEADRRGLGCRRALPGRHLRRRRLAGVERPVPRRRQELRPGRQRHRLRPGEQARGQSGRLRPQGARSRAQHQLRHLPRRLHPERPRLVQREAQRGQRRGQPRRRGRQPELELRRRGADRRSGDRRAAQPPDARTSSRSISCPPARRCSRWATKCAAPSRATTTPIARTTTSAGSTGASLERHADLHRFVRLLNAYRQRRDPAGEILDGKPHAAHRTGQDPVERRRSRPPRLERPLAHAGRHAGKPARPLPAARDLQRVLGAARLRAAAGADELSRLAALHRHGAGVARRHLPHRRRARGQRRPLRGAAAVGRRARAGARDPHATTPRSPRALHEPTGGSDADRGRGEPHHRRRPQPRLHDCAAR